VTFSEKLIIVSDSLSTTYFCTWYAMYSS